MNQFGLTLMLENPLTAQEIITIVKSCFKAQNEENIKNTIKLYFLQYI